MRSLTRRSILAAATAAWATGAAAQEPDEARTPRVLFIGNSLTYANDLPEVVRSLYALEGLQLETQMVAKPNFSLGDHWDDRDAQRAIRRGRWNAVVLQQGPSSREDSREMLRTAVRRFAPLIVEAGATPALFSAWPQRQRMDDFPRAAESYALAAADVNGIMVPVADAWREAFQLVPSLDLYSQDGLHPSRYGTLLAALVVFGALTSRSPQSLVSDNEGIALLQEAAANALSRVAAVVPD
jgi:hypothetical protein